jgi:predicted homoserine dehydrogenase-like protein
MVMPRQGDRWSGHRATTRTVLQGILRRAVSGTGQFTLREKVLANICEFRALTANGELITSLHDGSIQRLSEAEFLLDAVGAASVRARVSVAIMALRRTSLPQQKHTVLLNLERDLVAYGPLLDDVIAVYAQKLLGETRLS